MQRYIRGSVSEAEMSPEEFARSIEKISRLTDDNDHGEALREGALLLGQKNLAEIMKHVTEIHRIEGSLTRELRGYRDSVYDRIMKIAKAKLSPGRYELFYGAF